MLYGETLGPILAQVEARINTFLLPMLDMGDEFYAEFNVAEKLQGDFEAQTQALQSSVGRPWRTANEARALQNLPAVEGGDDLVVPLNVLIGGQKRLLVLLSAQSQLCPAFLDGQRLLMASIRLR